MEIKNISINEIEIRDNSRLEDGDISGLAKSIKENGLLQPIVVKEIKQISNGFKYQMVIGHRRYAAFKKLKWDTIPAIAYQNMNDKGIIIRNLVENLQRENVSAAEVGRYYHKLIKDFKLSVSDISRQLGIPESTIKNAIEIYSYVPKEYRETVKFVSNNKKKEKGIIPVSIAKKIIELERDQRLTVDAKSKLFDAAMKRELTNDRLYLTGIFLKYGMEIDDAIKLSEEYDFVRVWLPIKKKEIEEVMKKHNVSSRRKLFRDILAGDLKITFNIPKIKGNE